MNHARGGLKTCLHRGIWNPVEDVLAKGDYKCDCDEWAATAGYYMAALVKTHAYPLEKSFPKNAINTILDWLQNFSTSRMPAYSTGCDLCSVNWKRAVAEAGRQTKQYFDGLCIDCMDRSKYKRSNPDQDYWKHLQSIEGRWDKKCRVSHGEPSWYVSWCGRDEHRQALLQRHRRTNPRRRR